MPKRTAVIDIGSNSMRLVIYQRTSRFGFHLICEKKAQSRISEGSFQNNGYLQEEAIERVVNALYAFREIIKDYKVKKTLIIATAAVRNAPNRSAFIQKVRKELGFNIKVIDGNKEAFYGALAAINLLPLQKDAITIDIGGGSSDIALIKDGKITQTLSLDIGTITIKELFFDKNRPLKEAIAYIQEKLQTIPAEFKNIANIIAIGGVLRALAKSIMVKNDYSFKKIHAFEYEYQDEKEHFKKIIDAKKDKELEKLSIKPSRFDTIRQGVLIFQLFLETLNAKNIITSGVGLREGVFLHDKLRNSKGYFPKEINPSIVSILDRFNILERSYKNRVKIVKKLFELFHPIHNLDKRFLRHLIDAAKISDIGKDLTIYDEHKHAYYIASQELNWQYNHEDMLLIATLLRSKRDKLIYKPLHKEHKKILPSKDELKWMGFLYTLSAILDSYSSKNKFEFDFNEDTLTIYSQIKLPLFFDEIKNLKFPVPFDIQIKPLDKSKALV